MSEHLLFLQAAGSDFGRSHDLVNAIAEAIRAPHDEQASEVIRTVRHSNSRINDGFGPRRPRLDPERIAERVERAGCKGPESLLVALAAHVTIASPLSDVDVDWIASAAARIGDADLLRETAGVVFAFNTINRIADARRVRLEYHFLRELKPIQGWVERRLASLTGLAYDLSYKHQPRHSPAEMLDRLGVLFERLGAAATPDVFNWLSRSPVVLEGILEMIEVNLTSAGVHFDLLKEAVGIAVASRAMPGSGLTQAVDQWLSQGSLPDSSTLRSCAAPPGVASGSGLVSACRRYAWQVANAAYTITDKQIRRISALGLSDAELLDLTLATALFSALAIIEPMSLAVAPLSAAVAPLPGAGG
jgi:alkylhydroperoxidase family enzyme